MKENIYKYSILIIDFGSQYSQLVVRQIREMGIYCELYGWDITEITIRTFNPSGIILSGGPESTTEINSPSAPDYVFQAGIPVLGICYGMQTMVVQLGGKVKKSKKCEFGYAQVKIFSDNLLVRDIKDNIDSDGKALLDVWMSHSDEVVMIPKNFISIASTEISPFAIIVNEKKQFYGVQFHPEVTHTNQGKHILERFVLNICNCIPRWIPNKIIEDSIYRIRKQIGNDGVILGLSGGVDSLVTAMLLHKAIGKQLTCIFVDNGLLRLNEASYVMEMFRCYCKFNIIFISEEDRFLSALAGVQDPEKKRNIIGQVFIDIFNEQAMNLTNVRWLAQGTIYSDVIESAATYNSRAHVIKSHHNVGGLPKKMKMNLLEPLKELFKDEVYKIGIKLGLPYKILYRHPFPGPGLGVRILGEIKKEYCDLLRQADAIFIEELHKANLYNEVSQAFTVFLPINSVGIRGDNRKYNWVISLRAVKTIDFMTAHCAHLPYQLLNRVSNRIINEIDCISRVVFDISSKPPATIEWE